MTIEHTLLVSLDEIKAVVLKCSTKDCGSRIALSPEKIDTMPQQCPHNHHWIWEVAGDRPMIDSPVWSWLQLLKRLRDPMAKNCGFKVCLEFDAPKTS